VSRFPAAFRPPAFACRVILFPPGDWAFLTVGLPGALRPDPDGVSTFRTARYDRGGCPLYPGDGGALPASGAPFYEASTRVHAIHPSGLPLACDHPDGTGGPWAFPCAPHPAVTGDARQGGAGRQHAPGTTRPT